MDPVILLVVALVCAAVGFLIGILLNTLRGEREPSESQPEVAPKPPSTQVEVARFFRDRPGEPIQVEMEGKTFGNSIELNTPQREILEDLIIEVRNFLGQPTAFTSSGYGSAGGSGYTDHYAEAKPAFSTADYTPAAAPAAPAAPAIPAARVKSIVGQIDDILQDKLSLTGHANEGIRLTESPNQGAVVMIGRNVYPSVDDIPDPEIKELIHQSVIEWERQAK